MTIPGFLPATVFPLFTAQLPPGLPAGSYTVFFGVTEPDALVDGEPEWFEALGTVASFTLLP